MSTCYARSSHPHRRNYLHDVADVSWERYKIFQLLEPVRIFCKFILTSSPNHISTYV